MWWPPVPPSPRVRSSHVVALHRTPLSQLPARGPPERPRTMQPCEEDAFPAHVTSQSTDAEVKRLLRLAKEKTAQARRLIECHTQICLTRLDQANLVHLDGVTRSQKRSRRESSLLQQEPMSVEAPDNGPGSEADNQPQQSPVDTGAPEQPQERPVDAGAPEQPQESPMDAGAPGQPQESEDDDDVLDGSADDHQNAVKKRKMQAFSNGGTQDNGTQDNKYCVPRKEAHEKLAKFGYHLYRAAPDGNCCVYAFGAGHEISQKEAESPTEKTLELVSKLRGKACDVLTSPDTFSGVSALTWRELEGLPIDRKEAVRKFKKWRRNGHWTGNPKKGRYQAAFQFAVAREFERSCIVLTLNEDEDVYQGLRVYGKRDREGKLVRAPGTPVTIPSWFGLSFEDVLEMLRSETPCSLVAYANNHFSPFLKRKSVPASS